MSPAAIIVFIRYPTPGRVKTRLARSAGDDLAARIYKTCSDHLFSEVTRAAGDVHRFAFYAGENDRARIRAWVPDKFTCLPQVGEGLGEKMTHALNHVFEIGYQRAVLVGSDVPDISCRMIEEALKALDVYDIVLGPSRDGGFYLVGSNCLHPALFDSVSWSSENVFKQTVRNVDRIGLSLHKLPTLRDIDTEQDLRSWFEENRNGPEHPLKLFNTLADSEAR